MTSTESLARQLAELQDEGRARLALGDGGSPCEVIPTSISLSTRGCSVPGWETGTLRNGGLTVGRQDLADT